MFIRSIGLAALVLFGGSAYAADSDSPLDQDLGKSRPLIVVASTSADPALVAIKKALEDPATKQGFADRHMVLYTVAGTIGQRDGKYLDPQPTMALIRALNLGVSASAQVVLIGKDGEKKMVHGGPIDLKDIFSTIDQMPMAEKEAAPPPPPAAPVTTGKAAKNGKNTKAAKAPATPEPAPQALDD